MLNFFRRNGVVAALMLVAVAVLLSAYAISRLSSVSVTNCRELESLKHAISGVIVREEKNLGRPGSAGYAYYHTHPAELAAAKASAAAQLRTFAPRSCG